MSLLSRLFDPLLRPPPIPLQALWEAIVGIARDPVWYSRHGVPDTLDGRFDMVALVTALVMLRLEREGRGQETAWLTEAFVADMDGSLREIGVGDLVVGKEVGRMVGALGGRLGAYRTALAPGAEPALLTDALARNVYRGDDPVGFAAGLADAVHTLDARIATAPIDDLLAGRLP